MPAFTKALKDPFVHARVAGLMGFMATIDCFEVDELASKVIPSISFTLVDTEKLVTLGVTDRHLFLNGSIYQIGSRSSFQGGCSLHEEVRRTRRYDGMLLLCTSVLDGRS